jgi:vacuolar-type H+-ATPase subunit B/Vma2
MACACHAHDLEVFASGAIQGRILDASGTPLDSAPNFKRRRMRVE